METELGWKLLGSASPGRPAVGSCSNYGPRAPRMLQAPRSVSPSAELAPVADS